MFEIYIDEWNQRWLKLTDQLMWNSETGWGGWFYGIGLHPESLNSNREET